MVVLFIDFDGSMADIGDRESSFHSAFLSGKVSSYCLHTTVTERDKGFMIKTKYDIAVLGGGHNGLVAACYLALAGKSGTW